MNILESIVLGIVQGLTEFLPVSSSGHLVLLQKIFNLAPIGNTTDPWLMFFDTMVHLGTLIAVVIVMWRDIIDLFRKPFKSLFYLVVATLPAVIAYLLFPDFFKTAFGGAYLGYAFLLTAVILSLSEIIANTVTRKKELKSGGALTMGLLQIVGMLPGVSRSGSTIAGGLAWGSDREKVARFSFLMSIPAIIGANLMQGIDLIKENVIIQWAPVIVGTVCAALAGYVAVRFMLSLIQRKKLYGFAIYTAALGVLILLDKYFFRLINW
jgi:undecaprenyl-diphosphatase